MNKEDITTLLRPIFEEIMTRGDAPGDHDPVRGRARVMRCPHRAPERAKTAPARPTRRGVPLVASVLVTLASAARPARAEEASSRAGAALAAGQGDEPSGRVAPARWGERPRRLGVEVDAIRPLLASQYQLKATLTLWRGGHLAGELVAGANALLGRENGDGKQTEVQAVLGYRQFFWRGLHVEGDIIPGYAHHTGPGSSTTHEAFVMSSEAVGGYRWDLDFEGLGVYLLTDLGAGIVLVITDRWPTTSASKIRFQQLYFAGNIAVGARF